VVLRVIQWATGSVGRAALECILDRPDLELVGCWVHSEAKRGKDVGELIGRPPVGVIATDDVDEILGMCADAVMYAPLTPNTREVTALLRSGKNVITPVGWFFPAKGDSPSVENACQDAGVSLHGTGIDPGGATEVFPLVFSSMSSAVTSVRAEEFTDVRSYGAPDVLRQIMLFGATPEEAANGPMVKWLGQGFVQSVRMITSALGLGDDIEIRTEHQIAVATAVIDSPIGKIEPGLVAAQKFHWEGVVDGAVVVRIGVEWLMGEENLDPPWTLGDAGERYEIEITGEPDAFITINGWQAKTLESGLTSNPGIVATAAHCVNSIPYVCAAAPGIRTSLDLPLITGRAHAKLLVAG
jgi:hypothetical protein